MGSEGKGAGVRLRVGSKQGAWLQRKRGPQATGQIVPHQGSGAIEPLGLRCLHDEEPCGFMKVTDGRLSGWPPVGREPSSRPRRLESWGLGPSEHSDAPCARLGMGCECGGRTGCRALLVEAVGGGQQPAVAHHSGSAEVPWTFLEADLPGHLPRRSPKPTHDSGGLLHRRPAPALCQKTRERVGALLCGHSILGPEGAGMSECSRLAGPPHLRRSRW